MTDHPILFNSQMVKAILREIEKPGEGKTQTRRVLKQQPFADGYIDGDISLVDLRGGFARFAAPAVGIDAFRETLSEVPFGVGDRLYVRETWQALSFGDYLPTNDKVSDVRYAASDCLADADKDVRGYPWRPSIHMPRWASRITLEVTAVRVERYEELVAEQESSHE